MTRHCIVIDVGKTNVKMHVVDDRLQSCFSRSRANQVIAADLYPHYDIQALWHWMCACLAEIARDFPINVVVVTTHGATAALVNPDAGESGLVMPVMDYEFEGVALDSAYEAIRPPFSETCSPALPAGLNLGRQLFWQQRSCEHAFADARYLLPYPQYWAWRLTGVPVAEVTSWGCHTDLWAPLSNDYSSLVDQLGLRPILPPLVSADAVIGCLSDELVQSTGLPADCQVIAGLHDSNASYLRYLSRAANSPFTIISTGTWVVSFSPDTPLGALDEARDMLANVDINGNPVACARFMGGREFAVICQRMGSTPQSSFGLADLQAVVDEPVYALPDFSEGSGPFGQCRPDICGQAGGLAENGAALASLYCALMLDYELELLASKGDLIIEGAWLQNALLCGVLAQLRSAQQVFCSVDTTGTVSGAAQLAFGTRSGPPILEPVAATEIAGLGVYRSGWRKLVSGLVLNPAR